MNKLFHVFLQLFIPVAPFSSKYWLDERPTSLPYLKQPRARQLPSPIVYRNGIQVAPGEDYWQQKAD